MKLDGEIDEHGAVREPGFLHRNFQASTCGRAATPPRSAVVAKFLETMLDPDSLNFVNSWLARIWKEQGEAPTRKALWQWFGSSSGIALPPRCGGHPATRAARPTRE